MKKRLLWILIFILLFIVLFLLFVGFKEKTTNNKKRILFANLEILLLDNMGRKESEYILQDDYSNVLTELLNSEKSRENIQTYYNNIYNIKNKKINFTIKSINKKNTKYQIRFLCEELDKDDCQLALQKFISFAFTELEINYNLTPHKIYYQFDKED